LYIGQKDLTITSKPYSKRTIFIFLRQANTKISEIRRYPIKIEEENTNNIKK